MITNQLQKNIPKGWDLMPVGDVFTFVRTYAFSRENLNTGKYTAGKIGNIHYGDIHSTFTSPNIDLNTAHIPLIKDANFTPKNEDLLKDGDLVMADASEDYEGIGVTVSVHGLKGKKVVGGLHTFVLRDETNKTIEYYRQFIFRNPDLRNKLQKVANGVSVYGVSKSAVSKILLPIPPLAEQKHISDILETWDKAIDNLTQKIELKKSIKKGLMQRLLTGKKRLTGFKKDWIYKKIGEVCKTSSGGTPKADKIAYYFHGDIPWLNSGEVRKGRIITFDNFITKSGLENSSAKIFPIGTVLVAMYGVTAGQIGFLEKEAATNQAICGLLPNKNINSEFLYFLLLTKTQQLLSLGSGAAQPNISQEIVRDFDIFIPSSVDEQIAIIKIISMADKEIIELEKKLSIIKDQKKFLLNNLITGTIRTPKTLLVN